MESVLPRRYRMKANNLLDLSTTKLPILWITDFIHHMRCQTSIEDAIHLWDQLYTMHIETPTDSDQNFLLFLQDVVMEWVIEHHYIPSLVDFYFYNFLLLHFKCIIFATFDENDQRILLNYLDRKSSIDLCPTLKRMNTEMREVCKL